MAETYIIVVMRLRLATLARCKMRMPQRVSVNINDRTVLLRAFALQVFTKKILEITTVFNHIIAYILDVMHKSHKILYWLVIYFIRMGWWFKVLVQQIFGRL